MADTIPTVICLVGPEGSGRKALCSKMVDLFSEKNLKPLAMVVSEQKNKSHILDPRFYKEDSESEILIRTEQEKIVHLMRRSGRLYAIERETIEQLHRNKSRTPSIASIGMDGVADLQSMDIRTYVVRIDPQGRNNPTGKGRTSVLSWRKKKGADAVVKNSYAPGEFDLSCSALADAIRPFVKKR